MAATGATPISLYYSATSTNVPTAGNLVAGELAINTADGKLFYKDSAGVVQVIGTKGGVGSSTTTQVLYNSSGLVVGSANMTFSGTALTLANDASISGLTVGKGGGSISTNTAVGYQAINATATGTNIVAVGYQALYSNTSGVQSTAVGYQAAYNLTTASNNVAIGYGASYSNQTGDGVIAIGVNTLRTSTASYNTAVGGGNTMYANTTGTSNAAFGGNDATSSATMRFNTTGSYNSAYGFGALALNTTASNNTAVGYQAGYSNTTSNNGTFIGYQAGYAATGTGNTFIGHGVGSAVTTGTYNTFIGRGTGDGITTGSKNSIIGGYNGNQGGLDIRTASNYIVLSDGDGYPALTIGVGVGTYWRNSIGTGAGTNALKYNTTTKEMTYDTSSARYKDNIRDSVYGLDSVMSLRSAMFEYKKEKYTDIGLIAEEVELVIPELVGKNEEGQPDSVSYDRMVSVLIKAIQELKAEFDAYKATHP